MKNLTTIWKTIANYLLEQSVSLYPNPTSQYVDVLSKDGITILNVEVYDMYGKLLLRSEVTENPKRVNVSELASGVYLMRVVTDRGRVTKRFVRR